MLPGPVFVTFYASLVPGKVVGDGGFGLPCWLGVAGTYSTTAHEYLTSRVLVSHVGLVGPELKVQWQTKPGRSRVTRAAAVSARDDGSSPPGDSRLTRWSPIHGQPVDASALGTKGTLGKKPGGCRVIQAATGSAPVDSCSPLFRGSRVGPCVCGKLWEVGQI